MRTAHPIEAAYNEPDWMARQRNVRLAIRIAFGGDVVMRAAMLIDAAWSAQCKAARVCALCISLYANQALSDSALFPPDTEGMSEVVILAQEDRASDDRLAPAMPGEPASGSQGGWPGPQIATKKPPPQMPAVPESPPASRTSGQPHAVAQGAPVITSNDGPVKGEDTGRPLSVTLSAWFATLIGAIGSAAYLVAVWVGLIGPTEKGAKDLRLLAHFSQHWKIKIPLYVTSGGAVAMVFQLTEAKLIPVQAFIIGCTWPAVVANYLSARQAGELPGVKEASEAREEVRTANQLVKRLDEVPPERQAGEGEQEALDRLLDELTG